MAGLSFGANYRVHENDAQLRTGYFPEGVTIDFKTAVPDQHEFEAAPEIYREEKSRVAFDRCQR